MKRSLIITSVVSVLFVAFSPISETDSPDQKPVKVEELIGAWQGSFEDDQGAVVGVAIMTEGYFSVARFDPEGRRFLYTMGGKWELVKNQLVETTEFNTLDSTQVGSTKAHDISVAGNTLTFTESGEKWMKIDDMTPGQLGDAWLITGRERNGELRRRTPGARKTMKILSGTRFQWIAYNTDSGQFFGTGGGTYTTEDGKYVENIDFFSRNADRVGSRLEFDYEIKDGEWHHKGLSSSGNPIYEIWSSRSTIEE